MMLHALKVIALLHCVHDPGSLAKEVSRDRIEDALTLVEYHRQHTLLAYEYLNIPSDHSPVGPRRTVLAAIRRLGGSATIEQIRNATGRHFTGELIRSALIPDLASGAVEEESIRPDGGVGRSATQFTLRRKDAN